MNHYNKSVQEQRYKHHRKDSINNPSFSSTLLDTIYRSIDESDEKHKTMKKTKHGGAAIKVVEDDDMESFRRACFDEKGGKVRRKSMADMENTKSRIDMNNNNMKTASWYSMQRQNRPRLVRTSLSSSNLEQEGFVVVNDSKQGQKENGFVKTIKKVKQPISPGGKLASFLSSIFNSSSAKKSRRNFVDHHRNSEMMMKSTRFGGHESTTSTTTTTTCSSASSFSRSCLSKTTTTTAASTSRNNVVNAKRSVRFCPVSTFILDEGCPPCMEKSLYQARDSISGMMEESRRVEEAARDLLKKYKSNEPEFDMRVIKNGNNQDVNYDDDDDAASCASSDLFELDNLSAIGIDQKRYREELPVYETTHLDTNLAIAKGLIL